MTEVAPSIRGAGPAAPMQSRPLYLQIMEALIQRVVKGDWGPGELLPSEMKLAQEYGVHQGTVRKALDEMAAQHLVFRQQGKGTFVAAASMRHSKFHFFRLFPKADTQERPTTQYISCERAAASASERQHLAMPAKSGDVVRSLRIRLFDDRPIIVERVSQPADLFPGLEDLLMEVRPETTYSLIERRYRVLIVRVVERLTAVSANQEDAGLLGIEPGTPLLEIERIATAIDGRPVEWRTSRCLTGAHEYVVELT